MFSSSSLSSLAHRTRTRLRLRLRSHPAQTPRTIPTPSAPFLDPNTIIEPDSPTISLEEAQSKNEIIYRSLSLLLPPDQPSVILSVDFKYARLPTLVSLEEAQRSDEIRYREANDYEFRWGY